MSRKHKSLSQELCKSTFKLLKSLEILLSLTYEIFILQNLFLGLSPSYVVISYTAQTWTQRSCFIFRNPDYSATIHNTFLLPFTDRVWIILGAFGCVFVFMLNLIERSGKVLHNCKMLRETE